MKHNVFYVKGTNRKEATNAASSPADWCARCRKAVEKRLTADASA